MGHDLIDTNDLSREELARLLELVGLLEDADRHHGLPALLARRSLAMIFEEPSTPTRVPFEVAMARLGGNALYLKPGEIHLVADVDFVYTDLWWWFDQEDAIDERHAAFMPRYQVDEHLMAKAPRHGGDNSDDDTVVASLPPPSIRMR
jgi:ornithine carbamoyltransferase